MNFIVVCIPQFTEELGQLSNPMSFGLPEFKSLSVISKPLIIFSTERDLTFTGSIWDDQGIPVTKTLVKFIFSFHLNKQNKTISFMGALRGLVSSPMQLQKDSPPSSSFPSSLRRKSSSDMFQESPQPTSLGDSSQGLPLSCQTAESSPHFTYLNQLGSERGSSNENILQFQMPEIVQIRIFSQNLN